VTGRRKSLMINGRRQSSCDGTSRMNREVHVRFCERLGVQFPGPTRHSRWSVRGLARSGPIMLLTILNSKHPAKQRGVLDPSDPRKPERNSCSTRPTPANPASTLPLTPNPPAF
jgi:hypothetical protein